MCAFQLSLLSMNTPKYFATVFSSTTVPFKVRFRVVFLYFPWWKCRKFDFLTFKLSLFAASQSDTLDNYSFKRLAVFGLVLSE